MEGFDSRQLNSCALLSEDEFRKIVEAAETYVRARSVLMSFMSTIGKFAERGIDKLPTDWQETIVTAVREALEWAAQVATTQMEDAPGREASDTLYKTIATLTGIGSGAVGLPAIVAELPVSTGLMLRSIADIGRSLGASMSSPDFVATCIETFAYGGPLDEDDDADLAFFATRIGAPRVAAMITEVAARYVAAMTPRIMAMTVPVVGAVVGGGINLTYMQFYQSMARVLFTLLPIEKAHDRAQVRSCFAAVVREIRDRKRTRPIAKK